MNQHPKLRDSKHLIPEIYPIGNFPEPIIIKIGGSIVYLSYTGRKDITGDDWGDIFAKAIDGTHLKSPVGIADVVKDRIAWSMKTVKCTDPFKAKRLRIISGRCSPDYSYGIEDPHADIQKTGEAVLAIWNSRVDIAAAHYPRTRENILVRNDDLTKFCLFEIYLEHYNIADFEWRENRNNNFEGYHRKSGIKYFTWQPHGSQFTTHIDVPDNAIRFSLRKPEHLSEKETLEALHYDKSWLTIFNHEQPSQD